MTAPYSLGAHFDPEAYADDWEDFLEWKAEHEREATENPISADWVISPDITPLPF
jgi:hypothetical protein